MQLDVDVLRSLVETAPEGVVVCDARTADFPVVYVNPAMQQLTGYPADEMLGRGIGFLQGNDQGQEPLQKLLIALHEGTACSTVLSNYRRDGSRFADEMRLVPLRDAHGQVSHFASFHRLAADGAQDSGMAASPSGPSPAGPATSTPPATNGKTNGDAVNGSTDAAGNGNGNGLHVADAGDPSLNTQALLAYVRDDTLTGLLRRSYFEELLNRDWQLAQRDARRITVMLFDLDSFKPYFDVFGRAGADQTFRRIARVIGGCFRRGSDLCGRFGEDQIIAISAAMPAADAKKFAETVLARVRDLAIHHPRSNVSRYVTATAGGATSIPPRGTDPQMLIEEAVRALQQAKDSGRNRAIISETELAEAQ